MGRLRASVRASALGAEERLAVRPKQRHRLNPEARMPNPDRLYDLRHLTRSEDRVDLGNLLAQLVSIALRQAAGHDQSLTRPVFLCSAISRMVSMDSCFALSMNAQVLTMSTSASAASRVN